MVKMQMILISMDKKEKEMLVRFWKEMKESLNLKIIVN